MSSAAEDTPRYDSRAKDDGDGDWKKSVDEKSVDASVFLIIWFLTMIHNSLESRQMFLVLNSGRSVGRRWDDPWSSRVRTYK